MWGHSGGGGGDRLRIWGGDDKFGGVIRMGEVGYELIE